MATYAHKYLTVNRYDQADQTLLRAFIANGWMVWSVYTVKHASRARCESRMKFDLFREIT